VKSRARIDATLDNMRSTHLSLLGAGVRGGAGSHWLADPEATVLMLANGPARAFQEFGTWLIANERHFSPARLKAWAATARSAGLEPVELLATARDAAREREPAPVDELAPSRKRLRLRSLLGSGSRVEIVIALMGAPESARRLAARTGFTPRALRIELSALLASGWLTSAGTHPETYYIGAELTQLVGELPRTAQLPWMRVVCTLHALRGVTDLLVDGGRGAQLQALSVLQACRFEDRPLGIRWGADSIATPVTTESLTLHIDRVLDDLSVAMA
jgi:hypothetical protein